MPHEFYITNHLGDTKVNMKKLLNGTIGFVGAFFLAGGIVSPVYAKEDLGSELDTAEQLSYRLDGLEHTAEILVDKWGVSHLYAGSVIDAFYLQGFNAAKDRLWQMDLWHRRGLGKLAEVFGPEYKKHDVAARHFLYRGDMEKEWAVYGAGAKKKIDAFVKGVNAYIGLTRQQAHLLPQEFVQGSYAPDFWQLEDVVNIRIHALVSNLGSEVSRAKTICKYGLKADSLRSRLEPEHVTQVPAGLDVCSIPGNVLELYNYAHLSLASLGSKSLFPVQDQLAQLEQVTQMQGSNSWVISADKSATGRAVLAGDPHRLLDLPSSRYMVHMSAPGLNVIGAGEPFAPGISMGHNEHFAYGLTYFYSDQEDLYVYDLNPENADQYRYQGAWENFKTVKEVIKIAGSEAEELNLKFSRHGPVIYTDKTGRRAFAVRAAKLGAGGSPYLGSLRLMQAKSFADFKQAMKYWHVPTLNMMYAGLDDEIGWSPTGLAPYRSNWDGLLPVPGDGRYEWSGYTPVSEQLGEKSPDRGWIATANNMNLPENCRGRSCNVGYEWAPPFRYDRIAQVLSSYDKIPFDASKRLQLDKKLIVAENIVNLVRDLMQRNSAEISEQTLTALAFFARWNAEMDKNSAQAHLFMTWYRRHLGPAIFAALDPARLSGKAPFSPDVLTVVDILEKESFIDYLGHTRSRDQLIIETLTSAYKEMTQTWGPDHKAWVWGNANKIQLQPQFRPDMRSANIVACNPLQNMAVGGNSWTVNIAISSSKDRSKVIIGPSPRLLFDVGEWDNSLGVNMPGQSGDSRNGNYCNLAKHWENGTYIPLLYSRDKIQSQLAKRITLEPRAK